MVGSLLDPPRMRGGDGAAAGTPQDVSRHGGASGLEGSVLLPDTEPSHFPVFWTGRRAAAATVPPMSPLHRVLRAGARGMARPAAQKAAPGRAGPVSVVFAGIWLFFLVPPFVAALPDAGEPRVAVGAVGLVLFAGVYLAAFETARRRQESLLAGLPPRQGLTFVLALTALSLVLWWALGDGGTGSSVYVAVTAAMLLPSSAALLLVLVLAVALLVATYAAESIGPDPVTPLVVLAAGFVMWGVKQVILRNLELVASRETQERLAVEEERSRFARDLHDLLGHSLTVVTVKAELAARLLDADPERARREVLDIERLAREALADVRRAVQGYRELTLPGEVARARAALGAAGIRADLPTSVEHVSGPLRELFAWAIREGVTNVVRHSGARRCTVELAADQVVVADDGHGPLSPLRPGNGLAGLQERARSVGAQVLAAPGPEGGFRLEVSGTP